MLGLTGGNEVKKAFIGMLLITAGFFVYYYEGILYERYLDPRQRVSIDAPQETPPRGFLVPTDASRPTGYELTSARYTRNSTQTVYSSRTPGLYVPTIEYDEAHRDYATVIASLEGDARKRTLESFSWNGRDGVVVGEFLESKSADPVSLSLYYNDTEGRIVTITARAFSTQDLIKYLKTLERIP